MHPWADLSAFLDGALAAEERAAVETHLTACAVCRSRLAELRETARLIAALPLPAPSRSLLPGAAPRFAPLRPLRSLATVASGAFLFLFIASSVLATGSGLGGGGVTATRAVPAAEAGRPAAPGVTGATPAAAPAPVGAAATARTEDLAARSAQATPPAAQETGPKTAGDRAAATAPPERPALGPTPWLWLALAVASAAVALVTHRRLRTH